MKLISKNEMKRRSKISKTMKGRRPKAAILANTGRVRSEKTKAKISLGNIGKGSKCRKKKYYHSKETIEKIRLGNLGRKASSKTRKLQSKLKIGNKNALGHIKSESAKQMISLKKIGQPSPRKNAILSKETKQKISISKTGWKPTEEQRLNYSNAMKKMGRSNIS